MVLFPIALLWVAVVLYVVIKRSTADPDQSGGEPRRWRPRPRTPPPGPAPGAEALGGRPPARSLAGRRASAGRRRSER
jgi:hypothetical protein